MKYDIVHGGILADKKTYIMSGIGVLSAVASYLVGDTDVFVMIQAIFTIVGIYFVHKSGNTNKGKQDG